MTTKPHPLRLTVLVTDSEPQHLTLSDTTVTLGRSTSCTVPIRDRYLSRNHAEIVWKDGHWLLRDANSANGTELNGVKVTEPVMLHPGDRIVFGDTQVVFEPAEDTTRSQLIAVDEDALAVAKNLAISARDAIDDSQRVGVLASLAMQFIEARPMSELFDFILERVSELLHPSRVALALLGPDGHTFVDVHLRRSDATDSTDLTISRTLLAEVIEERNVVSFVDTSQDERLARAESIIAQQIRSAVCAPLLVGDDVVRGVLYLDFLASYGAIAYEDVRLIAQIARFAAIKLETTRLREEALAKQRLEEELKTAYVIQSRLLPTELPKIDGYVFAGANRPVRTVSGDYYDVIARPNGKIYFVIADVSGKGITAALLMSSLATAFEIFTRTDPSPAELVGQLNVTLAPKTGPTKFVTLVVGLLDPATGDIEFTNAGHVPPLVLTEDGVKSLTTTDMVVGLFPQARYRTQTTTLAPGDALVLFTDGVTEAANEDEEELGLNGVSTMVAKMRGLPAPRLLETVETEVQTFVGNAATLDDVTMLALTRV